MIDFSNIPMGFETSESSNIERIKNFHKKFELLKEPPTYENLTVTLRTTNGCAFANDYYYTEYVADFGKDEGNVTIYETVEEDSPIDPVVAVFCNGGGWCGDTQPIILAHLFVQLTRTRKIIKTDLHDGRLHAHFYGDYMHEDGDDNPLDLWPDWFRKLVEAAPIQHFYHFDLYDCLSSFLSDPKQTELNLGIGPTFGIERDKITKAIDRIVDAERMMLANNSEGGEYFCPEEGLFFFASPSITHHDDLMEATYTGLAEECENPLRELVSRANDDTQLQLIFDYLKAVDELINICNDLP